MIMADSYVSTTARVTDLAKLGCKLSTHSDDDSETSFLFQRFNAMVLLNSFMKEKGEE